MATSVVMPALDLAQQTGRLLAWRKQEGDVVSKGEPLMEIETDKAVVEIEAEADGILAGIRAKAGDETAVGETIAWILTPGESLPAASDPPSGSRRAPAPEPAPAEAPAGTTSTPVAAGFGLARADEPDRLRQGYGGPPKPRAEAEGSSHQSARSASGADSGARPLASPKARRLAAERGIDLTRLQGSGSNGAVLSADVIAAPAPADAAPAGPGSTWRLMADRVTTAWTTVPQFFANREVDAEALTALRAAFVSGGRTGGRADVTYTDLLVRLVALALRAHPDVNARWVDGRVERLAGVHIGIATAVDQGVVVPVVRDAGRLTVPEIALQRRELVDRARSGRLRPADLSGATFTISNLGMYGIDAFTAIVNAPQAAILAVGRIRDAVVAREGQAVVRRRMTVTLTSDHRVLDGARAAAFLGALADAIERPEETF